MIGLNAINLIFNQPHDIRGNRSTKRPRARLVFEVISFNSFNLTFDLLKIRFVGLIPVFGGGGGWGGVERSNLSE